MNHWMIGMGLILRVSLAVGLALNFSSSGTQPGRTTAPLSAPVLGTYPATSVDLSGNAAITPDSAPLDTTSINVSTDTNFKGTLAADPSTGIVRVTNAYPAGTYVLTVRAFGADGLTSTSFSLTVTTGIGCTAALGFTAMTNVGMGNSPRWVAVGDFNNDSLQDLAVANYGSNIVAIRLGDGQGGFTGAPNVSVGTGPYNLAVGDFNNDGKQDLAVANYDSTIVSIRLGDGLGGFTGATNITVGTNPRSLAVGDFNNDGKQDLAVVNYHAGLIRLGNGMGGFSGTTEFPMGNYPYSISVGDFNDDGYQDLAASRTPSIVLIRMGDGTGSFTGTTEVSVGPGPNIIAVADINYDRKQDLEVGTVGTGTVSIRIGDGTGGFSGDTYYSMHDSDYVVVGDFNNDGLLDIASPSRDLGSVLIRRGDGKGGFSSAFAMSFRVGTAPRSMAVGDFNNDGKQDFATANSGSNNVSIALGNLPLCYAGNGNTDGSIPAVVLHTPGSNVTVSGNTGLLVKSGYTFSGWNTAADGSGIGYAPAETFYITTTTILYAQWTINQYTISFEENGGSAVSDITADFGTSITAPTTPTRDNYDFAGWYTDNGTFLNAYTFSTMPAENVTLYAKWAGKYKQYFPLDFP